VLDPMGDFGGVVGSAAEITEYWRERGRRRRWHLVVRPQDDADLSMAWHFVSQVVDCVVVVDEIDRYAGIHRMVPELSDLAHYGRHRAVSLVGTARRPANVNRDLTALADELVCCRVTEPRDLAYLAQWMGTETAQRLASLPDLRYIRSGESDLMRGI